jgi:cytochrome c oxidase subunit II
MSPVPHDDVAARAERVERRWAGISVSIIVLLVFMASFAGIHQATMPQSRTETVDPRTLQLSGEFIESNLGSALNPDGSVTVRFVGQQYSFTPYCILVPTDTPIVIRGTSADVVHGFLVSGTNINIMLVPGYVSTITTRFSSPGERLMPCHEFCGVGHEGMWAHVHVIDRDEFARQARSKERVSCAGQ